MGAPESNLGYILNYTPGRLRWLPESTPPSQDLPPPLYCDNVKCIWLPESVCQSQNIPPFSTTIWDPSQNLHPLPLRIYLSSPCRAGDKGDLSKKFDQVCVWYRWKGYLSGSMENGCWGVASGGIGHQKSFKFTTQGHLKKKCDLTKNFD